MIASGPLYERRWQALAVLCLSLLIVNLDNLILNVALPTLARELSATGSQLQWMVDAYVLIFAGLLLTAGAIGDRFGRKKTLFTGFAIFSLGSVGASLSGSANFLIAMRVVMGVGGALIMPSTLSILTNIFPPQERPRAIAYWTATVAVGIPTGPVLGGLLLEHFAWGSVFLVNLPIVVVAAIGGSLLVPESRDPTQKPLDPLGALLSIASLGTLVFAIIEAPDNGWTSVTTLGLFVAAGVLLVAFVWWELTRSRPLLDMSLFRKPAFSGAALSIALVFFALFASIFFVTQYLQFVLDYSPLAAGIRMTPVALGLVLGTILSTRSRPVVGTRIVVAAGLAVTAGGLAILATVSDTSGYTTVLLAFFVAGFGMGLTSAPATNSIMGSVPREQAGVASAINNITRPVGGALGVAILGSLLSTAYSSSMEAATASLPAATAGAARDSIGSATRAAGGLGGPEGHALLLAAQHSFIDAMSTAILVGVGVALAGAAIAAAFLPSRQREMAAESGPASGQHGPPRMETSNAPASDH
jgi:EmrB/QacA subfamily drug resistance transporter